LCRLSTMVCCGNSSGSKCCDMVSDKSGIFTSFSKRWCTDILCLLFFLATVIGMVTIAVFSLNNGSINYILYPTDYLGQFCGHSGGVGHRAKAYYPQLDQDIKSQLTLITSPTGFVNFQPYTLCLEECPTVFTLENPTRYGGNEYPGAAGRNETAPYFYASFGTKEVYNRCLPTTESIPAEQRDLCNLPNCTDPGLAAQFAARGLTLTCTSIISQPDVRTAWEVTEQTRDLCTFPVTEINSQQFLPNGATPQTKSLERQFAAFVTNSFAVLRSITDSWEQVVVMGVAAPFAFAAVWFVLLFFFAGFIIYLAILLFLTFLVALTIYMYVKAGWASSVLDNFNNFTAPQILFEPTFDTGFSQTWYAVFAVVMTLFTMLAVILVIVWRRVIARCIAIVREVTKIFFALPFIMAYPVVGVVFESGIVAYGIVIGCFIVTQGHSTFDEIDNYVRDSANSTYVDNVFGKFTDLSTEVQTGILLAIHIVGCVWAYYVTQACVYGTLARACAVWFFSHEVEGGGNAGDRVVLKKSFGCGFNVILSSAWCIFYKHLGSMAFGAAIISIVKIVKYCLMTVDHYTKELQGTNFLLRLAIKCSQCVIWCLDKSVRFITYYGFIFVAIEGSNFCSACFKTMGFWIKYPTQITVNEGVQWILSAVISLSIPTGCAFVGFVWIDMRGGHQPIWSAGAIWILAYVIAGSITDVFKCAIDTIFICAFQDMEEHSPPKYMSEALKDGFGMRDIQPINRTESNMATDGKKRDTRGISLVRPSGNSDYNARM